MLYRSPYQKQPENVIRKPLSEAIYKSIKSSTVQEKTIAATVISADKKKDKSHVSNFRTGCLLNCFTKIYETYIKNYLVILMKEQYTLYILVCRKGYSFQHILILVQ